MMISLAINCAVSKINLTAKSSGERRKFRRAALAALGLLCLSGPLARATVPSGLTLTGAGLGTATGGQLYNSGTDSFTITGTGNGVFNNGNDNAFFAYTTATGDMEIVARLVSFTYPVNGSEAGLTIRQSLTPWETNRSATWFWSQVVVGGQPAADQLAYTGWGPTVAGNSNYYSYYGYAPKGVSPPYWLKLVRVGNNYGSYWSLDGRDWSLITNSSGGALFGTGSFNVGFFVSSGGSGSLATANFDNVYVGAPRLKYKTTWIGNTTQGIADGYASNATHAMWVKPDGTCYANSNWDEFAQAAKAYKDGKVAFQVTTGQVQNSNLFEGTVTGNTSNLFWATKNGGANVFRTDFNGNSPTAVSFTTALGDVSGLAASATRLFVSDSTNHNVRIVDLTMSPPTQIGTASTASGAGIIGHPGPIAYDGTNFWITDCGSPLPLSDYVTTSVGYTPAIKCFDATGAYQSRSISGTGITNPTALAKDPTQDRLYVCDNGTNQNVRYYSGLAGTPTYAGSFGVAGGVWYSSSPGTIYESGLGGWQRFYGPTGVGVDSSGNIYVACNGTNAEVNGGTDIRKFDTSGNLVWKVEGLEFVSVGDFDSGSDGQEIYTIKDRFTMNYANTAPGSEYTHTAFTKNPFQANDVRNPGGAGVSGSVIRRLAGNNVFMYTSRQGTADPCVMYRFNNQGTLFQGTTATPFARIYNGGTPSGYKLWFDTNGDGLEQSPGEDTQVNVNSAGGYTSYDVDSGGDIWMVAAQGLGVGAPPSSIGRLPCTGSTTIGSSISVPAYNPAGNQDFLSPAPIYALQSIKYDKAHDVMYCMGQKKDGIWVFARYDNWLASSATTPDDHTARYVTPLPARPNDITVLAAPGVSMLYNGMGFAGDKIFIGDLYGPIRVFDANLGNPVITLSAGPEVSSNMGWEDMIMGVNAFKRSTGEYEIMGDDTGWNGRILLYRWTPAADTTTPGAATNLVATATGHAIALAWMGSEGTNTSYNIYRGTTSGSLTLYQSNVSAASFTDTNVTPGTTYYYTVAAVSTVGAGAQSNQASAAAVSSQADFVKYDTTTLGNWNPTGIRVYGADGYCIPGSPSDLTSLPAYVTGLTHVNVDPTRGFFVSPDSPTDPRALQKPSGSGRTSAYYNNASGQTWQSHQITISGTDWHQVSIYLLSWTNHTQYDTVQVLDTATGTVLDTRQPMDYYGGKWLVWNVRGNVTIRISQGWYFPTVSGIFFDPVKAAATPEVGWWKLDETTGTIAADSSGAGNNATKTGGTWTTGGKINGCVTFGGTNGSSNLSLPTSVFNLPKITVAMWFKTSTSGVLLGMQLQSPGPAPTNYAPVLYVGTDGKLHGSFYTGVVQTTTSSASVNNNAWHHAALTSDGTTQTLFLDGEVASVLSTTPVSLLPFAWGGQGYVSGWPNTSGTINYFTGLVDDMRLYNRVVANSEIWKLNH